MKNDDDMNELNKRLWEAIRAWRDMNFQPDVQREFQRWEDLLHVPEPDFSSSHDIFAAIESDRFGVFVVMTDATNCAVERLMIRVRKEDAE